MDPMVSPSPAAALDVAERAAGEHRWAEAIAVLSAALRTRPDVRIEERLVDLRRAGPEELCHPHGGTGRSTVPDHFSGEEHGRPPEISRRDLSAELVASALQHHGSLIVRGMLDPDVARPLLSAARSALDAAGGTEVGDPDDASPWFKSLEPGPGDAFLPMACRATRLSGSLLLAESPRALQLVIDAYRRSGMGQVIAEHLGEWPALSVTKTTIRRADSTSEAGWHQDGAFLGTEVRTVNVWTALTPAGVEAPGIQLFARPFDHLAERGTEGARFDWSVSDAVAASYGLDDVVSPRFEPGDALLFDQMLLHRTHVLPEMTAERVALEMWFFAPSSYPAREAPLRF